MTQQQIAREVARATGESIGEIQRRGFSLADRINIADPEPYYEPSLVDWDALQQIEPPRRYHPPRCLPMAG